MVGIEEGLAHQVPTVLDSDALRFVQKHFSPIIEAFIDELKLNPDELFSSEQRAALRDMSEHLESEDQFSAKMGRLAETHKKLWEEKKSKGAEIDLAAAKTQLAMLADPGAGFFKHEVKCPACQQRAVLLCEIDGEYIDGEAVSTGAFVTGLTCSFCELALKGHEQIDHFQLDSHSAS